MSAEIPPKRKDKESKARKHVSFSLKKVNKVEPNLSQYSFSSKSTTGSVKKSAEKLTENAPLRFVSANVIGIRPHLTLPKKLKTELKAIQFEYVSPSLNISGNYSRYIHAVIKSMLKFKDCDFDSIFSSENKSNICYQNYAFSLLDEETTSASNSSTEKEESDKKTEANRRSCNKTSDRNLDAETQNNKRKRFNRSKSMATEKGREKNMSVLKPSLKTSNKEALKKSPSTKKLLILDLDETLVHSEFMAGDWSEVQNTMREISTCEIRTIEYIDDNSKYTMDIYIRPYLDAFLSNLNKVYDMAIFSAGLQNYVDVVISLIDPDNKYFKFKLYRDSCVNIKDQIYIKDLRIIQNFTPEKVILMDNSLYSFLNQPSNGMLVNSFFFDGDDTQLLSAENYLMNYILVADDVRQENEKWFKFEKQFKTYSEEPKQRLVRGKSVNLKKGKLYKASKIENPEEKKI